MARLSLSSVARLALLTCSGALIVWALVQMFSVPPDLGELEVRVENADLRLPSEVIKTIKARCSRLVLPQW